MYPASIALKGKAAMQGSDTEKRLATMLFDEAVQVLSSFELNQIASLTYNDGPCEEIFTMLEEVMSHPLDHSVLCVQKALVVTKHVTIYGSEKCVNSAWALGRHVDYLREFNTVLAAQQRSGPEGWLHRIKGGGVDKGFPVREAASSLHELLQNPETLQMQRHTHADPNSLVPVGDDRVAFVSDDVRHYMLKKRIEQQQLMHTKSNLAKERGGFGSGYLSKDGKTVVGAAHSVEEMLARAQREKQKYTDEGPPAGSRSGAELTTSDLFEAPPPPSGPPIADLLDCDGAPPHAAASEVDLLDFTSDPEPVPKNLPDLLGTEDSLAVADADTSDTALSATADLLSLMAVTSVHEPAPPLSTNRPDKTGMPTAIISASSDTFGPKASIMSSNVDRFAALDALEPTGTISSGSILSGKAAENRILGMGGMGKSTVIDKTKMGAHLLVHHVNGHGDTSLPIVSHGQSDGLFDEKGSISLQPVAPNVDYSSIHMAGTFGKPLEGEDDLDDGFVMGGTKGSGLEPAGPAPAAPPPPPPPM